MSSFLLTVGIILISLTPLVGNILLPAIGILLIALSTVIENQKTLINKSDIIIEHLKLNRSLLQIQSDNSSSNTSDNEV
ncbi:hypothetical protein [Niameybacter massiliensis]|uniref:hypothetical protein n=1 Tax=Niameybacter massiliensis TaxID=1658108 RepID=UPI0006B5E8FF|nr:hypothetical protein [Niameybacter massiliensis]